MDINENVMTSLQLTSFDRVWCCNR